MNHSKRKPEKNNPKGMGPSHVIALLTDFGSQDQYVAAMKGVILSINPAARIVDISHEIMPQRIRQGGYLLWSAYKFFPDGTIFVCVVDPGVGSRRRIIALRTKRYTFLAPDNNLLDFILNDEKQAEAVEITEQNLKKISIGEISATFHGRDIFAPLAAHISAGFPPEKLGQPFSLQPPAMHFIYSRTDRQHPNILHIDRFGNIILNMASKEPEIYAKELQAISIGSHLISRWIRFYEEAPDNTPCLLVGSSGLLEVTVKNSSAAHLLNATLDTVVRVYWR
jgi:S-adenosyl-L-methionine hydrolase (adenosine-forming)